MVLVCSGIASPWKGSMLPSLPWKSWTASTNRSSRFRAAFVKLSSSRYVAGEWCKRKTVMNELVEIQFLNIAELVWDGSDCLVGRRTEWSFTLTPRACVLLGWLNRVEFYIDTKGLCLVGMRTEWLYIVSKGLCIVWRQSGVLHWLQGLVPCWDDDRVEFYIDSKGLCHVGMRTEWFYIDSKGLCHVGMRTEWFYIDS